MSDAQIVTNELQAATAAMNAGQFSPVGTYFAQTIKGGPDNRLNVQRAVTIEKIDAIDRASILHLI